MEVYTKEKWHEDKEFKAVPGQEITEEVYYEMMNVIDPVDLPVRKAEQAWEDYRIPVHSGFMMSEPHSSDLDGFLYHAFGMNCYGNGEHYFYLGLSRPAPVMNGTFYFFDCMTALPNDGMFKASEFDDRDEAIRMAADYEATLTEFVYLNGERLSSTELYSPAYF